MVCIFLNMLMLSDATKAIAKYKSWINWSASISVVNITVAVPCEKECVVEPFIFFFYFFFPTQSFSALLPGVCLRNISRFFTKKIIFFFFHRSLFPFPLLFSSVLDRFDIWTRVTEIKDVRWRTGSHEVRKKAKK